MANWSRTEICILFKNIFDCKHKSDEILNDLEKNGKFNFVPDYDSVKIANDIPTLIICGESRWGFAIDDFVRYLNELNIDTFNIIDYEPGSDFFIYIEYRNGILINEVNESYICKEGIELLGIEEYYNIFEYYQEIAHAGNTDPWDEVDEKDKKAIIAAGYEKEDIFTYN